MQSVILMAATELIVETHGLITKYHGTSSLEVDNILANGFRATDTPFLTDLAEARGWAQMRVENRQWRGLPLGLPVVVAVKVNPAKLKEGGVSGVFSYTEPIPANHVRLLAAKQPMTESYILKGMTMKFSNIHAVVLENDESTAPSIQDVKAAENRVVVITVGTAQVITNAPGLAYIVSGQKGSNGGYKVDNFKDAIQLAATIDNFNKTGKKAKFSFEDAAKLVTNIKRQYAFSYAKHS